jgi:Vacuolar (H+)-ATPase G subunit
MMVTDRTKRVKEARDEAKKEIDSYRKQKDDEFKKFEAEVSCTMLLNNAYHFVSGTRCKNCASY